MLIVLLLAVAGVILLHDAGRWLVREDSLQPADAIVVLSGRMPARAREAARLYREKWAPVVWVTRPAGIAEEMKSLGVPYVTEETYSQLVLIHSGVPAGSVFVFDQEILNTADEVRAVSSEMLRQHISTAIIVTSKPHTRRVRTLWEKLADPSLQVSVHAVEDDPFDASQWWRSTTDALDVVRELLGLFNAWAGLPLHPAR